MSYGIVSLEKRLKENIRNYHIENLFQMKELREYLKCVSTLANVSLLLTERHGEKAVVIGDYVMEEPDVVANPGRKLRVHGRTVGHLYVLNKNERPDVKENVEEFLNAMISELAVQAAEAYEKAEFAAYADDLEDELQEKQVKDRHGDKKDKLTGALSRNYFHSRAQVIERAEVIPAAVICININDWKLVNDKYGEEESDRLIQTVGKIVLEEAKPEYLVGRVDGDVFEVLIPMAETGEAEQYCSRVQKSCDSFQDDRITPSVACGFVIRTNIEQSMEKLYSDAEYEMFQNKYEIKHSESYLARRGK